jgi:hypothetical protein
MMRKAPEAVPGAVPGTAEQPGRGARPGTDSQADHLPGGVRDVMLSGVGVSGGMLGPRFLQMMFQLFFGIPAPLTDNAHLLGDRTAITVQVPGLHRLHRPGDRRRSSSRFSIFAHVCMIPPRRTAEKIQPARPGTHELRTPSPSSTLWSPQIYWSVETYPAIAADAAAERG